MLRLRLFFFKYTVSNWPPGHRKKENRKCWSCLTRISAWVNFKMFCFVFFHQYSIEKFLGHGTSSYLNLNMYDDILYLIYIRMDSVLMSSARSICKKALLILRSQTIIIWILKVHRFLPKYELNHPLRLQGMSRWKRFLINKYFFLFYKISGYKFCCLLLLKILQNTTNKIFLS